MSVLFHITSTLLVLLTALGATGRLVGAAPAPFTLVGGRVLQRDGTLKEGLAIVVAGQRIQRVAKAGEKLPNPVHLSPTSVISPGIIDVCSAVGAHGAVIEISKPVDSTASAADAVDAFHRDLVTAARAGITTAMVCPQPNAVVSGTAVTFRTAVDESKPDPLDVLRRDGPVVFALGEKVLRRDREPTSRSGAVTLLERALVAVARGEDHPGLSLFLEGSVPGVVFCSELQDVHRALDIFAAAGRIPHVVFTPEQPLSTVKALAERLKASPSSSAIIGPLDFRSSRNALASGAAFDRAGVPVVFAGGLPRHSRYSPRVAAALAVRHGMEPAAARRALTFAAAAVAGVSERIGSLEVGKDADIVVFSDDPLRLDARVEHVYGRGKPLFKSQPKSAQRRRHAER